MNTEVPDKLVYHVQGTFNVGDPFFKKNLKTLACSLTLSLHSS